MKEKILNELKGLNTKETKIVLNEVTRLLKDKLSVKAYEGGLLHDGLRKEFN